MPENGEWAPSLNGALHTRPIHCANLHVDKSSVPPWARIVFAKQTWSVSPNFDSDYSTVSGEVNDGVKMVKYLLENH